MALAAKTGTYQRPAVPQGQDVVPPASKQSALVKSRSNQYCIAREIVDRISAFLTYWSAPGRPPCHAPVIVTLFHLSASGTTEGMHLKETYECDPNVLLQANWRVARRTPSRSRRLATVPPNLGLKSCADHQKKRGGEWKWTDHVGTLE